MTPKKAIMISAVAVSLVLALSFGVIKVVAQINNQNSSDSSLTEQITQRENELAILEDEQGDAL